MSPRHQRARQQCRNTAAPHMYSAYRPRKVAPRIQSIDELRILGRARHTTAPGTRYLRHPATTAPGTGDRGPGARCQVPCARCSVLEAPERGLELQIDVRQDMLQYRAVEYRHTRPVPAHLGPLTEGGCGGTHGTQVTPEPLPAAGQARPAARNVTFTVKSAAVRDSWYRLMPDVCGRATPLHARQKPHFIYQSYTSSNHMVIIWQSYMCGRATPAKARCVRGSARPSAWAACCCQYMATCHETGRGRRIVGGNSQAAAWRGMRASGGGLREPRWPVSGGGMERHAGLWYKGEGTLPAVQARAETLAGE